MPPLQAFIKVFRDENATGRLFHSWYRWPKDILSALSWINTNETEPCKNLKVCESTQVCFG
ncbi:hypothetical protein I7I50_09898 [Histoplasma capsulatum G186AR]|uniref:Uncharacterized protein n=1 Tax=Ajellomyces capsulatus TaxID=5037 RepID=A0A8H8D692_AJECA|nr:hypothetical protein I7I52_01136 [Histoplasma capsulatum]QSS68809.1 hypothetical protein I7I50_09898 [Histoplasma capsulatum G186AR]